MKTTTFPMNKVKVQLKGKKVPDDVISFNVEVQIPLKHVEDLLVCAFEGGSNYWYGQLEPVKETIKTGHPSEKFYGNMMKHGFKLVDTTTDAQHEVKPEQFEVALRLMHSTKDVAHHFQDVLNENTDATTGDVFLQLLVFGEVRYG
jgi:hypothetical protein